MIETNTAIFHSCPEECTTKSKVFFHDRDNQIVGIDDYCQVTSDHPVDPGITIKIIQIHPSLKKSHGKVCFHIYGEYDGKTCGPYNWRSLKKV